MMLREFGLMVLMLMLVLLLFDGGFGRRRGIGVETPKPRLAFYGRHLNLIALGY